MIKLPGWQSSVYLLKLWSWASCFLIWKWSLSMKKRRWKTLCSPVRFGLFSKSTLKSKYSSSVLGIYLIVHPSSLTVLRSAGLINVIGHKPNLPVCTHHILIFITLGVVERCAENLCPVICGTVRNSGREFGDVTESVRSLYGARCWCCRHPRWRSAGIASCFCLPPKTQKKQGSVTAPRLRSCTDVLLVRMYELWSSTTS